MPTFVETTKHANTENNTMSALVITEGRAAPAFDEDRVPIDSPVHCREWMLARMIERGEIETADLSKWGR